MSEHRELEAIAKDIATTQQRRLAYRGRINSLVEQMETARSCYVEQGNKLNKYLDEFIEARDEHDLEQGLPPREGEGAPCTCERPVPTGTTHAEHCPAHSPHV